ncbi:SGNH/GDSL hydrolase family protein [Aureimonas sp. ME7]|uniref:SGNH/GDSL hydrolase family protein n=1 Tax=Aureimonas sp. ME7 TaxID=2744252 RepID=UPI0015FD634A|nr:SGNH/GDSL hydrolase family protein [Aureimonas sp. ME7]
MLRTCDASVFLLQIFTNYWNLATATAAEAIQIAQLVQDILLRAGRIPIWITDDPRGDSVGTGMRLSAANLLNALALRHWMLRQRAVPGVYVIDSWEALANPGSGVGDILTGYTFDPGLHLNQKGARRLGRLVSRVLDTIFEPINILPASNADRWSAVNLTGALNTNPFFTGTGGSLNGHSGQIGDGWAAVPTGNGITFAFAKVTGATAFNGQPYTDQEAKDWQQVTIGGTATNTNDVVVLAQTITGLTVGDVLRAVGEFEFDSLVNVSSLSLAIYDSTNTVILAEDFSNTTDIVSQVMENVAMDGVMRTPATLPLTANSARIHIRVRPASAAAISGVFRVRAAFAHKSQ